MFSCPQHRAAKQYQYPQEKTHMTYTKKQEALHALLRKLFEEVLPKQGFVPREKQIELANEILESLGCSELFLAEAEVGTGKTLAYLLPAVIVRRAKLNENRLPTTLPDGSQMPVVIATSGIALQRAIEQDYIPSLSDILMEHGVIKTPLSRVLRKGKSHYLCERRFAHFYSFADEDTKTSLAPLIKSRFADLALAKGLTAYQKRAICVDNRCGQDCSRFGTCRYMRYLQDARRGGYDFQVCNHNYLLADILRRAKGQRPLIPDYQAVVIDEAHKFLDAARQMYGCSLSLTELTRAAKDAQEITFAPGVPTAELMRETDRILSKSVLLFRFLNKEVTTETDDAERYPTTIRERTEKLILSLREDFGDLASLLVKQPVGIKYEARIRKLSFALGHISDSLSTFACHNDLVYWLEGESMADGFTILRGIPKELGRMLHRDLWSRNIPFILTSGTLSAAGSFGHIKRKMGLDLGYAKRLRETTKPSPFNYRENVLLYISEAIPFPDNRDDHYIKSVTDEAERLIRAAHGHTALLFTSYKAMDMVHERIALRNLPYPVFRMDRGGTGVIERFRVSGNGVIFASGALWEGIDIPGDILSLLIIARLPFAVPDPVSEWEKTLYSDMDEYKEKVIVPEMLIKLKQGFGRLIRGETDTGVVAILDFRAGRKGSYRRRVLAALPPCAVTSDIADVEKFMRDKKPAAYFS
jgi:ATP-dependent DNA helicase DinG